MSIKWLAVGQEAVGVVAIGQVATGVIAIGQGATGVVAIGQLARGVFVVGQLAYGIVAIGQLAIGVGLVGGMIGIGAQRWFGWTVGILGPRPYQRLLPWRLPVLAVLAAVFFFVVARPLWDGLFALGGAFNQPLR